MNLSETEIREVIKDCLLETLATKSIADIIRRWGGTSDSDDLGIGLLSAIMVTDADLDPADPKMISINAIRGLAPAARQPFQNFKKALEEAKYTNFAINSGTRSLKKQAELESTSGGAGPGHSYHNYGYALDIRVTTPDGVQLNKGVGTSAEWEAVAAIGEKHGIRWPLGMQDSNHFELDAAPDMNTELYPAFSNKCDKYGTQSDLWGGNEICNMPWEVLAGTETESTKKGRKKKKETGREDRGTRDQPPEESSGAGTEEINYCTELIFMTQGAAGCRAAGATHYPESYNPGVPEILPESVSLLRDLIKETIAARSFATLDNYGYDHGSSTRTPVGKKGEMSRVRDFPSAGGSRKFSAPRPMTRERKSAAALVMTAVGLAMLGNDRNFMMSLLNKLGLNQTKERLKFFGAWAASENTPARNNPLASTWPGSDEATWSEDPGMKTLGESSNGTKEYSTLELGVRATAEDIINNHSELLELLRDSNLSAIDYSLGYDFSNWTGIPDTDRYIFRSIEAGDISRDIGDTGDDISFMEEEESEPESATGNQKEDF